MKTQCKKSHKRSGSRSASSYQRKESSNATQVDQRSASVKQGRLMQGIDNSPMMALQRKQLERSTGDPVQRVEDEEELLQGKFETLQRQQDMEEEELLQGRFDAVQLQPMEEDDELMQGKFETVQRQEEEELLQGRFETLQRQQDLEEEELLQGKFESVQRLAMEDEELMQGKFTTVQRQAPEEDELLQGRFSQPLQRAQQSGSAPNQTGMPDNLKSGMESLSGMDLSDVRVHYNSSRPAQLNAHAYAQGKDIHLGSGQEKHLPHEAWHVVQQKQGRVKPTKQMKGKVNVNDDAGLEKEADVMGLKALRYPVQRNSYAPDVSGQPQYVAENQGPVMQRKLNNETIEQYKKTLMLNEVSIVELPNGGPKVVDKFSSYPADSRYNVPDNILAMSLLDVSMPGVEFGAEELEYYQTQTAHQMVNEMQGGGAFIAPFKLAIICEGAGDRALQHEMGHAEQQESLGAQFGGEGTTVNQVILEYHNILSNENEHNDFETVRTYYNKSNLGKHKDKTWDDLVTDATIEYPKNATLLAEIKVLMDEIFPEKKVEIKNNLISEYYVNVGNK